MRSCLLHLGRAGSGIEATINEVTMLDFTSALYLGLRHPSNSLRPWSQLTTGKPAALDAPANERRIAQCLAELVGCERAVMGPSTLHLFWDLFGVLAKDNVSVYLDAGTYPIAKWGVERAAAHGVPVHTFAHHDAEALERRLKHDESQRLKPVVVADGFCPGCGHLSPLPGYLDLIRKRGGYLVLDDTQALGILGHSPGVGSPYGKSGGGSLRWSRASSSQIIMVSSLAKGFGVPVAVLSGSRIWIERFESQSETRLHTSPPSTAVFHAAGHALAVNRARGDALRSRLAYLVRQFRKHLSTCDLSTIGSSFPVQILRRIPKLDAQRVHSRLLDLGIHAVLHRPRCKRGVALSFLITALHRFADIERAGLALAEAITHVRATNRLKRETDHEYFEVGCGSI
jgi:8-amino-7-oxononanoate synthase